ncbi:T9SS C-terminal target domain-containing protein [Chryseobacterium indologenes]|uniref:T9SS type A sorting domain-containing protein n=1 Tax=Chryseobacterium indologenes TaxID=253 RepID=UPI000B5179B5|nr:T9SS type A sorting domain-containing protein [Chryseobacterium indologenes]ASE62108.1 T9SS C-terminal target domain-containing protein [Chryseobacterium indologenes]
MKRSSFSKVMLCAFLFGSNLAFSQLISGETQIWEKIDPTSRDALKCKDENLLNFHCGIKDKIVKKFIRYSKNKSHTLSLVHTAKPDELIWENPEKNVALSNNRYQKGEKNDVEIKKRPSIFSFTSSADPKKGKSDSLNIKLSDQNLHEMIFYPRRATPKELNNIHSYLSIKFGISLDNSKYYSSEGTVIWDPDQHKDFKYRLTGLGRDDGNELYQKQSTNSQDQILAIGKTQINRTNAENPSVFNNNEFVLWSDDNKDLTLSPDENFSKLNRNWEISFIGSKVPKSDYSVRIEKSVLNPRSAPFIYWLFITDPSGNITKIQGIENDNYIFFNKVDFIKDLEAGNSTFFTFAVSPLKEGKDEINTISDKAIDPNSISIDLEKIVLYPNPVKKGQNFTLRFPPMENLTVSIYDGAGRLVALDKVDRNSNHYFNQLPIQSSYLINLTQNGKIIKTFKLIVE